MSGVNKVIIVGRLGNDPEMRTIPNGEAVANISVATSESWTDKNTGEHSEVVEWHSIVVGIVERPRPERKGLRR